MEVQDYDDGDDAYDDEDGRYGRGFLLVPFESFSSSFLSLEVPSPCGDLEFPPSIPVLLSSKRILTLSFRSYRAFMYASSYEIFPVSHTPDMIAMDSSSASGATCTSSILAGDKT